MKKVILIIACFLFAGIDGFSQKNKAKEYCSIQICERVDLNANGWDLKVLNGISPEYLGKKMNLIFYVELQGFSPNKTHQTEFILKFPDGSLCVSQKDSFSINDTYNTQVFKINSENPFSVVGAWEIIMKVNKKIVGRRYIVCKG
jgi:hypothetical protein